jgi:adenosylhomocysteinase
MHGVTGLPEYTVRDVGLAEQGSRKVEMAEAVMPVLGLLRKRYESERPFDGLRVAACLHVTKETAVLVHVLRAGGARVALCASNPLSTQDDVAASLAKAGFNVYAFRGMTGRGLLQGHRECFGAQGPTSQWTTAQTSSPHSIKPLYQSLTEAWR